MYLEILKEFGLLFEMGRGLLFPEYNRINRRKLDIEKDKKNIASIYVTPADFIPDSAYYLLVAGLFYLMEEKSSTFFYSIEKFELYDDHLVKLDFVKVQSRYALKLEILRKPTVDEHGTEMLLEPKPSVCQEMLIFLKYKLKTQYGSVKGVGFHFCVTCEECDSSRPELHDLEMCLANDNIRCAGKLISTAKIRRRFATDRGAVKAYNKALKEGKKHFLQTRLMLIGPEGVGKTSLTKALTGQEFDAKEEITDGIKTLAPCTLSRKAREEYMKLVVDMIVQEILANEEIEEEENKTRLEQEISVLDYPIRTPIDLKKLAKEIKSVPDQMESAKAIRHAPATTIAESGFPSQDILRAAVHKDTQKRMDYAALLSTNVPKDVTDHVIKRLEELEKNKELDETEDDLTLSIWDFGGQDVYYNTHQVFFVSRAIYILCFKLTELDIKTTEGKKNVERILKWLQFIYYNTNENKSSETNQQLSPPVFIVGTHRNSLPGNTPEEKQAFAEEKLAEIKEIDRTAYSKHVVAKYYAIENSFRSIDGEPEAMIIELRDHITEIAKDEPYMKNEIPIKWLNFRHQIEMLLAEKPALKFSEVEELAKKCQIDKDQVINVLDFLHDLGDIMYYGEHGLQERALNNIVVLDLNLLMNTFNSIYTIKDKPEQDVDIKLKKNLENKGLLSEKLLANLLPVTSNLQDRLHIMEKLDLLCKKQHTKAISGSSHEAMDSVFYAPALLKNEGDVAICQSESVFKIYIDVEGFLFEALFYRLLVRLIKWSQTREGDEPNLFYQGARLYLDEAHNLIIRFYQHYHGYIEVTVMRLNNDAEPRPDICKEVLTFLEDYLLFPENTLMKRPMKFYVRCSYFMKKENHTDCPTDCLSCRFNKQIECLFGEWKSKPDSYHSSSGEFTCSGGRLTLENPDIELIIPENAIDEHKTVEICIGHIPDEEYSVDLKRTTMLISPIVKCQPAGTTFNKPCLLSMPYNVPIIYGVLCEFTGHAENNGIWREITNDDKDYHFYIKDEKCYFEIKHFSAIKAIKRLCFKITDRISDIILKSDVKLESYGHWLVNRPFYKICVNLSKIDNIQDRPRGVSDFQWRTFNLTSSPLKICPTNISKGWNAEPEEEVIEKPLNVKSDECTFILKPIAELQPNTQPQLEAGICFFQDDCQLKQSFRFLDIDMKEFRRISELTQSGTDPTMEPITDENLNRKNEKLTDLFYEFGKSYEGDKFRWLRQLLFNDALTIDILSDENMTAHGLLNKLKEIGEIKFTDVDVLEEIAIETRQNDAIEYVKEYKRRNHCCDSRGAKLSPFRKSLFEALKETDKSDLNNLIHHYEVGNQGFTNIWDLVFYLEKQKRLVDSKASINKFARNLNEKAKSVLLGTQDSRMPFAPRIVEAESWNMCLFLVLTFGVVVLGGLLKKKFTRF